jgi:hypothetical protein
MSPSPLEGVQDTEEIYNSAKELDGIFEHKTRDEIANTLKVHFLGEEETVSTPSHTADDEEDVYIAPVKASKTLSATEEEELAEAKSQDDKIQDILNDL